MLGKGLVTNSMSTLYPHSRGICSNEENDPVKKRLDRFFSPLADSYIQICKAQERQFYGLRDFYRYFVLTNLLSSISLLVLLRCCTGCVRRLNLTQLINN